jgi:hypothetical protein
MNITDFVDSNKLELSDLEKEEKIIRNITKVTTISQK